MTYPQQHTISVPCDGITLHLMGSKTPPTLPLPITLWCDGQENCVESLPAGADAWTAVKDAATAMRARIRNISGTRSTSTVHVYAGTPIGANVRRHLWGEC